MSIEIELKFLVTNPVAAITAAHRLMSIRQGYLSTNPIVRVRIQDNTAFMTVKGPGLIKRTEIEFEIDYGYAVDLLELCSSVISKKRALVRHQGMTWEVDFFDGVNAGLVMAECELEYEGQHIVLPPWVGDEVSEDPAFSNVALSMRV